MRNFLLAALVIGGGLGILGLSVAERPESVLGEYATIIEGRLESQTHNAKLCLTKLEGIVIEPGELLSFNKVIGSWSRDQGYRRAPVSYGGTLIDSWGGGVCQTSTTLYNAALMAGLMVDERHRHHFAPSYVPPGRDAAVAYPNIDLKIRNPYDYPVRIATKMSRSAITVSFVGRGAPREDISIRQRVTQLRKPNEFRLGAGPYGRVRNPGKPGYEVETFRISNGQKEFLSHDQYPVMHRVVEFR